MTMKPPPPRLPLNARALSEVLQSLYASTADNGKIVEFIELTGWYVGAVSGAVSICDLNLNRWRTSDYFPANNPSATPYDQTHAVADPMTMATRQAAPYRFHMRDEIISPQVIATHPFFTQWYAPFGYGDSCTAHIPLNENFSCHVCFLRGKDDPPFTELEREMLEGLLPHIEQRVRLHAQIDMLTIFTDVVEEHFLQLGHGIIVLSEEGDVHFSNHVANTLLDRFPEHMCVSDGKLRLNDAKAQARYNTLVKQCIAAANSHSVLAGGALSVPRPDAPPIGITVFPYRRNQRNQTYTSKNGCAAVMLYDPARPRLDARQMLREMFHLSESEAEVCWRLGNGETVGEIAVCMGSTRETARSRLKRIYAKTNIKRQPDLVRLVLLGPSGMAARDLVSRNSAPF